MNIIDTLNKDTQALTMLKEAMDWAKKLNATPEETQKLREIVMLASILKSKEAFKQLSDLVYNQIKEREATP